MSTPDDSNFASKGTSPEKPSQQEDPTRQERTISGLQVDHQIKINLPDGQYDLKKLLDEVLKARGVNDQVTRNILNTLRQIRAIHKELAEWKTLHNHLNEIMMPLGDMKINLIRVLAENKPVDQVSLTRSDLKIKWYTIKALTRNLFDWAREIQFIAKDPFQINVDGKMKGPEWAINILAAQENVDEYLVQASEFHILLVYESFFNFNNEIEATMLQADKNLRETAGNLNQKSELVLGSLGDVEI